MKQFTFGGRNITSTSSIFKLFFCAMAFLPLSIGAHAQEASDAKEVTGTPPAGVDPQAFATLQQKVENLEAQIGDLRAMIGTFSSLNQRPGLSRDQGQNDHQISGPSALSRRENGQQPRRGDRLSGEPRQRPAQGPAVSLPAPQKRPDLREDGFVSDQMASTTENTDTDLPGPSTKNTSAAPVPDAVGNDAETLYKDAYSHMLRRDYASAQNAFGALIKNHPQSRMAGNAQYWLGETYYVRGKYRPAADAFLKAYRNYSKSVKAPDSLMKLALSLSRLGQKGAACKTFDELDTKYPNAPNHVKQRAGMERRRAGCN